MKEKTKKLVDAFGFLSIDEAQLLMDTAEKLAQNAIVVNVGAGVGTSALAIIEQRPDLAKTFYTVDMRDDDNPFGGMLNELHAFQNAKMVKLLPNQIKGDSSQVGEKWSGGEIDFLIIDADHTVTGLTKDIDAWLPHLSVGGYVAFHDYDSVKWVDVKDTVDNLVAKSDDYAHVETRDTFILFKKLAPKDMEKDEEQTEEVESIYRKADERTSKITDEQAEEKEPATSVKKTATRRKKATTSKTNKE